MIFPTLNFEVYGFFWTAFFFFLREGTLVLELVKVTWIIALPLNSEDISLHLEYLNFPYLQIGNDYICKIKFDNVACENILYL